LNKLFIISTVICVSASTLYCASAPEWVTGSSKKYPDSGFVTGVGIGDTLDAARSSSRAEIAKVFKSRVTQASENTASEKSTVKDRALQSFGETKTESKTSVFTDEVIEGVKVAETYFDKKKKTHYALAVLDRSKTRAALSVKIAEQEAILTSNLSAAEKSISPASKVRMLSGALDAFDRESALKARRRVVDPADIPDIGVQRQDILTKLADAESKITFVVDAGEDSGLRNAVSSRVTRMGFKIESSMPEKTAPGAVVLFIKCDLAVEPFERSNPQWKFYNWSGNLNINENGLKGKIIVVSTKSGQVSQLSEDSSRDKALLTGSQAMASMVEESINQYLFGK
jgi:hypothetical protein